MKIYLVGGAVRDNLLGLPIKDRDWVIVNGQPELLEEQGYTQVGKDFPVYLHPHTKEEYALARTERKIGKGYSGFSCYSAPDVTLEQDLLRRDLTINAIARTHDGQIIDPYHGVNDLSKRILRHVSPAFSEDPLRILRVARFAARFHHFGFTIASETLELMTTLSPELVEISPERVWQETEKALHTDYPHVYFKTLRECGALKVLFPEIDILFGVPAPEKWHPEIDTGIHTLLTLEQSALLSPSINIRFSALCHDIGKGLTPKELWPHHYGHCRGGIDPLKILCDRLRVPNQIRELALLMCEFHDLVHILKEVKPITLLTLFDHLDAWRKPERIEALAIIGTADYRGRLGWHEKPYPQADYLRDAFRVANTVDVAPIVTSGFQGKAIREELTRQRLAILTEWKTGKIRSNNSSLCSTSLE